MPRPTQAALWASPTCPFPLCLRTCRPQAWEQALLKSPNQTYQTMTPSPRLLPRFTQNSSLTTVHPFPCLVPSPALYLAAASPQPLTEAPQAPGPRGPRPCTSRTCLCVAFCCSSIGLPAQRFLFLPRPCDPTFPRVLPSPSLPACSPTAPHGKPRRGRHKSRATPRSTPPWEPSPSA